MHASYVTNFSDEKNLVGFSDNVFIGKIKTQKETKKSSDGSNRPNTKYEVEVIENIKGTLSNTVIVTFDGGYDGNKLYLFDNAQMLKSGKMYLFAGRYNKIDNSIYTVPGYGELLIDNDSEKNDLKDKFKKAYINENLSIDKINKQSK